MAERRRLGVLATHPIQYYSPLYRALAAEPSVDLTVYFAHRPTAEEQGEGFGVPFQWDLDLTEGYDHRWLANRARAPNVSTFVGCDTPAIRDVIRHERFDAFLVMGWHALSFVQAIRECWRAGVPVLVRGDSRLDRGRPTAKRALKRVAYPLFMRRFAACLSVGTLSEEYFRHYGARRVVRSPHFVDNERFAAAARGGRARRPELRARWGLPTEATVFLFVGKFIPVKRAADIVHALAQLDRADVRALFVGEGELRSACEGAARELGVPAHFAGFLNQSEMPLAYAAADVLLLPSARETWGLVVNEAMACGLPAVVSDEVGCAPDLVRAGVTGRTHRAGDVADLARRIAETAEQGAHRAMGAAAQRHIAAFSVRAAADGVMAAVDESVGAARRAN